MISRSPATSPSRTSGWKNVRIRAGREVGGFEAAVGESRTEMATLVLKWMAILAGAVLVARSTSSTTPLLWGLPIAAAVGLRTVDASVRRPRPGRSRSVTAAGLIVEVGLAATAVSQTGGWHSGWVVTLVSEAALCGLSLPARWTGQVASAMVIVLFWVDLAGRYTLTEAQRYSLNLDVLLAVVALAVAYGTWLARYGDRDRARLAWTNERLIATNDLLVQLEQIALRSEDATDPQQAARAVARLARKLLEPDVVVVASAASLGETWRVLLAEGVAVDAMVGQLQVLQWAVAEAANGSPKPVPIGPGPALLSDESRAGACIPLMIRGRLIGALILESAKPGYWSDQHYEIMAQLSPWAALLVDNACRFNALWVVGSAEQRARVARDLHDNLGQSMAALGLELDGIARSFDDQTQADRIRELRAGVTNMVAELRYTMRDLCCDVSTTRSLGAALEQLARGIASRSSTEIQLDVDAEDRLPLAQEHQILQMARTLLGAAVESRADSIRVVWTTDRDGGCLEVGYDGCQAAPGGFYETEAPILAAVEEVRDRCWAVGATVECQTENGGSSRVRCRVGS